MADYATEGGHWYKEDGSPMHTIIGNNGKERPTTLRDARKLGLYPSVTSIMGIIAKPGLDAWKQNQAIMAALTSPHHNAFNRGEIDDREFIGLIKADASQAAKDAAERGSLIHGYIESWFRGAKNNDDEHESTIYCHTISQEMICLLDEDWSFIDFETEKSCFNLLGYAGKVDLFSRKHNIIIDFKTKDGDLEDVKPYDEQCSQLAAYSEALGMPNARLVNVFLSRTDPRVCKSHEWSVKDRSNGITLFMAAFNLWCALKKFYPGRDN